MLSLAKCLYYSYLLINIDNCLVISILQVIFLLKCWMYFIFYAKLAGTILRCGVGICYFPKCLQAFLWLKSPLIVTISVIFDLKLSRSLNYIAMYHFVHFLTYNICYNSAEPCFSQVSLQMFKQRFLFISSVCPFCSQLLATHWQNVSVLPGL